MIASLDEVLQVRTAAESRTEALARRYHFATRIQRLRRINRQVTSKGTQKSSSPSSSRSSIAPATVFSTTVTEAAVVRLPSITAYIGYECVYLFCKLNFLAVIYSKIVPKRENLHQTVENS